ncbi:MAG: ATP cone domain-containing protein [Candidatus Nealsonbacteria bacterium]
MISTVIKTNGQREPFDAEKIKKAISMASSGAGVSEERKNELVEEVTDSVIRIVDSRDEVTTSELRAKILGELDQLEPSVSAAWRKYDEENKK